jgi:hypothetical protein
VISRALLVTSLLPWAALAQLQVFQFDGTNETPVGAVVNVGAVTPGDTVETRFRVRNIGQGPAVFQTLSLAGEGFAISAAPSLPYTIAPGLEAEFRATFSPTFMGTYSAFLLVNTINIILQGTAVPAASLMLAGTNMPLAAGSVIDFGSVAVGSSQLQGFVLSNSGSASITVATLTVSGTGFSGPVGLAAPIVLAPGQTASFQVVFEPTTGQAAQGTLAVDQRSFQLAGQGLSQPLPAASIVFASTLGASAQQNSVSITLASASPVSGTGTLAMAFQPAPGLTDDPSIAFLSGPLRMATVTVSAGDTTAQFNGQSNLAFQTGTTAGTIQFTLTLGSETPQQASLAIPPAAVGIETATAVRQVGDLNVSITAFDNTYSASHLTFTFYGLNGAAMQGGMINVDATTAFRQYFSATQAGGAFALLAAFPVSGDTTQIATVDVQVTNTAGTTTVLRVPLTN